MTRGIDIALEEPGPAEFCEWDLDFGDCERASLSEKARFVGAVGLSPVRELAWRMGLADLDEPALWEPA